MEYGDPENPDDWEFRAGATRRSWSRGAGATTASTPATPEMTGDGLLGVLYEPAAGGHGYGKDNKERASFTALGYNFLRRAIGWS